MNMNKPPDETLDAKSKPVVAACKNDHDVSSSFFSLVYNHIFVYERHTQTKIGVLS